jgi:hypothetical protein
VIRRDINGLRYYQFASLSSEPVLHGVFSRLGGVSRGPFASLNLSASVPDDPRAVTENRRRFYAALGVDPNLAIRAVQVHGARVAAVNWDDLAVVQQATDGLLTATPGLPLVMAFADCTPVLLYDPVRRAVGMVHAGWRGMLAGICQAAVEGMVAAFDCDPADIRASLGPAIGPCCYEVGPDVVDSVARVFSSADGLLRSPNKDRSFLDLWAANELALRQAGISQIERAGICTACHVDEFFSHRAERGRTGRFGAMIMLDPCGAD